MSLDLDRRWVFWPLLQCERQSTCGGSFCFFTEKLGFETMSSAAIVHAAAPTTLFMDAGRSNAVRHCQVHSGTLRYTLKRSTSILVQPSSSASTVSRAKDNPDCFNGLQQPKAGCFFDLDVLELNDCRCSIACIFGRDSIMEGLFALRSITQYNL